jgi:hypothetical protein
VERAGARQLRNRGPVLKHHVVAAMDALHR